MITLESFESAGLILIPIPPRDGKPTKGPTAKGWNSPASNDNPNGYKSKIIYSDKFNYGLLHSASHTLALDIDDIERSKQLFSDLCGLDIIDMLNDPVNFRINSPKNNRGKLIFKLPVGVEISTVHKHTIGRETIFELRAGPNQDVVIGRHPDGGNYEAVGDPEKIPVIPEALLNMAQHWEEWKKILNPEPVFRTPGQIDAKKEFLERFTVEDILIRNGYVQKGVNRFLRPGSTTGIPGVILYPDGRIYSHGGDELSDGHCHDAFEVYRILECGGDFIRALQWNPDISRQNKKNYRENVVNIEKTWQQKLDDHVAEWNKRHAVVMLGVKCRIMKKSNPIENLDGREGYKFYTPKELSAANVNTSIKTGEKEDRHGNVTDIKQNHFMAWYTNPKSDVYTEGVLFKPRQELPNGYFNTWSGFSVQPVKTVDYPLIKAHIEKIICQNDPELIKYFFSWIAFTFQFPELPVRSALVLRGDKGVGKGKIGKFIRDIWGKHGLYISQATHLTGNFNGHLADVCFLFADEAFFSGDKKHEGTLKALVTESEIIIERKGIDPIQETNYLKLFMVTNENYAVPATANERRWAVFDVSDAMAGNKNYFFALSNECMSKEVQQSFLADMMEYDVSDWFSSHIPETQGLKDQRAHSLNSIGKWMLDSLTQGSFDDDGWRTIVSAKDLKYSYLNWCTRHHISGYEIATVTALGRYLTKMFEKKYTPHVEYTVQELPDCIEVFQDTEKVDVIKPFIPSITL